jgi:hypothetical protein
MIKLNVQKSGYIKPEHSAKIDLASVVAEQVLNDPEFKQSVLDFKWEVSYRVGFFRRKWVTESGTGFRMSEGLDAAGVWGKIEAGDELQKGAVDGEVDIIINVDYPGKRGILGWTMPSILNQHISGWFLEGAEVYEIVGNMIHEWMHKVGFDHEYRGNVLRPFTVPYAVGDIAERIAKRLVG